MPTSRTSAWWSKITRDLVLFVGGLGFMAHEVLVQPIERPYIITACLGMMGLPVFLRWDSKRANGNGEPKP